jgi:hypothetical protein
MQGELLDTKPTPSVVNELLDRVKPSSAKERRGFEEQLKLSWYFGGLSVLYRRSKRGLTIVASGPHEEVRKVVDGISQSQLLKMALVVPERFETQVAIYCGNSRPIRNHYLPAHAN